MDPSLSSGSLAVYVFSHFGNALYKYIKYKIIIDKLIHLSSGALYMM